MVKSAKPEEHSSEPGVLERILDRESELLIEADEARQQGKELVDEVQADAPQIAVDTQKRTQAQAEAQIAAIKADTRKKIDDMNKQYDQECAALRDELMQNVDKGVSFVIDLVTAPMLLPMTLQVDKGVKYVIDRVAEEETSAEPGVMNSEGGGSPC
ncbi:MAG: hypothetical protein FWF45_04590 [Coriobacteriia bacterium]|nr:hypothetical protein [Coriobacteriia bacterium]